MRNLKGQFVKGNKLSEEIIEKIRKSHQGEKNHFFGKKHTEETKEKNRQAHLGKIPWNKGVPCNKDVKEKIREANKGKHYSSETEFKKGKRVSIDTEFKKGCISWNYGKKVPQISEEKNWRWAGDNVGYNGVHRWVEKHKGKPMICEHCGAIRKNKRFYWANKKHDYKRILDDYMALCSSCHLKYDIKYNNRNKK